MILSMTGYGEASMSFAGYEWRCIIQSVNSRYLDCRVKLPAYISYLEPKIRALLKNTLTRGKVDIFYSAKPDESVPVSSSFDSALVVNFCQSALQVLRDLSWDVENNQLRSVLLHEAIKTATVDNPDTIDGVSVVDDILELTRSVINIHQLSCKKEGDELLVFFETSLFQLDQIFARITHLARDMSQVFAERLRVRISDLLDQNLSLDEARLSQEVAYLVDKSDISEEIVRFQSHMKQFRSEITSDEVRKGKKLDFIAQEMLREINTIGSKANLLEITQQVISVKNILEAMREQVQNVV